MAIAPAATLTDGASDVPFPGDCRALCVQTFALSPGALLDCHDGAGPAGAAVWCTFEEQVPTSTAP